MDEPREAAAPYQPPPAGMNAPVADDRARRAPPRVWTTVLVALVALVVYFVASGIFSLLALLVIRGSNPEVDFTSDDTLRVLLTSRIGLVLAMVPPQIMLGVIAVLAALLSPQRMLDRLGLVRGTWPIWAWVAGAVATLFVGMLTGAALDVVVDESPHLEQLTEAFRHHATGGFLVPLLLVVGLVPGICEELLFRGYIQRRIVGRWGAAAGIFLASVLFALFHVDPVHAVAVFPLGLWLGFVAARAGSLWPAILGHIVNNVGSVVSVIPEQTEVLDLPHPMITTAIFAIGIPAVLLSLIAAWWYPPVVSQAAADPHAGGDAPQTPAPADREARGS